LDDGGTSVASAGFLCIINKGNNHETRNNGIGGSACALKHICAGTKQQWRHVRWRFHHGRFRDDRRHDWLIRQWKWDGQSSGFDDRDEPDYRTQRHHESIREHARAQWLAQRIDVDADRTGFRHQPIR
jgi:hypothetical protein